MTTQTNYPIIRPTLELDFANSKQLDPRITFTRSSPAVYYDGKTSALAEQNLFVRSQTFSDGTWVKGGTVTATDNATTAPDGTTTASSIIPSTSTGQHYLYQGATISGAIGTISVYAKANGYTKVFISDIGAATLSATYDLTAVTATVGIGCTTTITSVGNGWYRLTATSTASFGTKAVNIVPYPTGATIDNFAPQFTGDGTSGAFLWGAQVEQRSSATAYNTTTTTAITNYIPVLLSAVNNVPRFDCNPVTGQSLGLLVEQQSTNLLTYSGNLANSIWTSSECTIISNSAIAPDGSSNTILFIPSANSAAHWTQQIFTSSGPTVNGTVYVKKNSSIDKVSLWGGTNSTMAHFNLTALTTSYEANVSSTIITSVGNGWYRLSATFTGSLTVGFRIYASNGTLGASATAGDGFSGIYIWGAQLEALAFPTSYIPTVATTMTRSAEISAMTGTNFSSWFNLGQGTIYTHTSIPVINSSTNNLFYRIGPAHSMGTAVVGNGTIVFDKSGIGTQFYYNGTATSGSNIKTAFTYNTTGFTGSLNGGAIATSTNTIDTGSYQLSFGSEFGGGNYLNGYIRKLSYYPYALSNAQLQALTSS